MKIIVPRKELFPLNREENSFGDFVPVGDWSHDLATISTKNGLMMIWHSRVKLIDGIFESEFVATEARSVVSLGRFHRVRRPNGDVTVDSRSNPKKKNKKSHQRDLSIGMPRLKVQLWVVDRLFLCSKQPYGPLLSLLRVISQRKGQRGAQTQGKKKFGSPIWVGSCVCIVLYIQLHVLFFQSDRQIFLSTRRRR